MRTDAKLHSLRAVVRIERLPSAVISDLNKHGEVCAKEHPSLARLLSKRRRKSHFSADAEIDRLCDLAALEKRRAEWKNC